MKQSCEISVSASFRKLKSSLMLLSQNVLIMMTGYLRAHSSVDFEVNVVKVSLSSVFLFTVMILYYKIIPSGILFLWRIADSGCALRNF